MAKKLKEENKKLKEENKKLKSDLAFERTMLDNVRVEYKSLQNLIKKKLKESIDYMDMPCVFYYTRLLEILNFLIRKKGY